MSLVNVMRPCVEYKIKHQYAYILPKLVWWIIQCCKVSYHLLGLFFRYVRLLTAVCLVHCVGVALIVSCIRVEWFHLFCPFSLLRNALNASNKCISTHERTKQKGDREKNRSTLKGAEKRLPCLHLESIPHREAYTHTYRFIIPTTVWMHFWLDKHKHLHQIHIIYNFPF